MRKHQNLIVTMALIAGLFSSLTLAVSADYYVSPAGSDSHDGTLEAPFATVQKARDAVREKIKRVSKDYTKLQFTTPLPDRDIGGQDTEVVVVQNWSISRELIDKSTAQEIQARTPIGWVGHMACLPKPGMSVFFEHALAFVKTPGQWYLDRTSGVLYYKAQDGANPNQHRFAAPVLEQLMVLAGVLRSQPISSLSTPMIPTSSGIRYPVNLQASQT